MSSKFSWGPGDEVTVTPAPKVPPNIRARLGIEALAALDAYPVRGGYTIHDLEVFDAPLDPHELPEDARRGGWSVTRVNLVDLKPIHTRIERAATAQAIKNWVDDGIGGPSPLVLSYEGTLFVYEGLETVVAMRLLGQKGVIVRIAFA